MEGKVGAYGYEGYYMVAAINPIVKIDARSGKNHNNESYVPHKEVNTFGNILKKEIEKCIPEENSLEGKPITYGSLGQIYSGIKLHKMYNETA